MVILNVNHLIVSTNFLLFLKYSLIFMNIQIRSFVKLIILVKMQCLNLNLVPSFAVIGATLKGSIIFSFNSSPFYVMVSSSFKQRPKNVLTIRIPTY